MILFVLSTPNGNFPPNNSFWGRTSSETVKLGIWGALVGITAPLAYSVYHFIVFHPNLRLRDYSESLETPVELGTFVFISGAIGVMGVCGALVGRLRENEARRLLEMEARNQELSALNAVADIISRTRDIHTLLHLVLKELASLSYLSIGGKGFVFLRDENNPDTLGLAARVALKDDLVLPEYGIMPERCACLKPENVLHMGDCQCFKVIRSGETVSFRGGCKEGGRYTDPGGPGLEGRLLVPITDKGMVLGVMVFSLPAGVGPTTNSISILSAVASQLALAVENAALFRQVSEANEDIRQKSLVLGKNFDALRALAEVDRLILSTLDRDDMLSKVGDEIRQVVSADLGGVALNDSYTGNCRFLGGWGVSIGKGDVVIPSCMEDAHEVRDKRPVLKERLSEDTAGSHFERLLHGSGVRSCITVPIVNRDNVSGMFFLGSKSEGGLSWHDFQMAVTFASRMGAALDHVRVVYDLEEMSVNIIHALASAIDAKSAWTKGHSERVALYAMRLGERLGCGERVVERLRLAGLLHDIGKIGTYDMLLDKTGELTEDEHLLIKLHPNRGCEILEPITGLRDILPAVRHHHERWDGTGYPAKLKGEDIPLEARILCVADSFDTMTADRPYRASIGVERAVEELKRCSGTQFAPEVVDAFLNILKERGAGMTATGHWQAQTRGFTRDPHLDAHA